MLHCSQERYEKILIHSVRSLSFRDDLTHVLLQMSMITANAGRPLPCPDAYRDAAQLATYLVVVFA